MADHVFFSFPDVDMAVELSQLHSGDVIKFGQGFGMAGLTKNTIPVQAVPHSDVKGKAPTLEFSAASAPLSRAQKRKGVVRTDLTPIRSGLGHIIPPYFERGSPSAAPELTRKNRARKLRRKAASEREALQHKKALDPDEETIWATIDSQYPRRDSEIVHRLELYTDMLTGRDIYDTFFTRSPMLPDCSSDTFAFQDPSGWVTALKLQCGEYIPLEKTVGQVSYGMCEILEPAADTIEPVSKSSLLSHRLLQPGSSDWPRGSTIGQISRPPHGYVAWARSILRVHRDLLRAAGVYEAIYASMFDYSSLPFSWVRGIIESWDMSRKTCWVGQEESTITLWDLQAVSGLPIYGHPYEECIPPDEQLFRRRPSADTHHRGEIILPFIYPALLSHYRQAYCASGLSWRSCAVIPVDVWIHSFVRAEFIRGYTVSPDDPFDLGLRSDEYLSEETAEPSLSPGDASPAIQGINEDLF